MLVVRRQEDELDVSLGRAEVERSNLNLQLIIINPVSFYALSDTKQVFRMEHLARKSVQPSTRISQGRFCFWKWESRALPLQRLLYSCRSWWREGAEVAPGSTHFFNSFHPVNSWWLLFTVNRLPELVYFGSAFAPSLTLVDSHSEAQFCLQAFGVKRNLFPNHPRNGAGSKTE